MLRPRIIPCLLVKNKGLVKTVRFTTPKYVGDPLNAVRIFNEKEVDELIVVDIDATVNGAEPDYTMIKHLAAECRMPLCYGGGVRTVDQAVRIIKSGVEKVAISAAAVADPTLISSLAHHVGRQSVVTVIDVKPGRSGGRLEAWTCNGTAASGKDAVELARAFEAQGAGEIVVNVIEQDGVMKGYDLELLRRFRDAVTIPMTVLGGAGSLRDIEAVFRALGIVGAAAGSLFVFKGVYRAVLINYPSRTERQSLYAHALAPEKSG